MTTIATVNSPEAIQSRLTSTRFPRLAPILMVFARPAFAFLAQGLIL